jgi:Zn-dependent protease with chaperone function
MINLVKHYRSSKETVYNIILCLIGGGIWVGLLSMLSTADGQPLLIVFAIYIVPLVLFYLLFEFIFRAKAMGNMLLVSKEQFPHIHVMLVEGAEKLDMQVPEAFIYNSNGLLNAFARQVFGRKYVLLTSAIIDATSDDQIKFIIGHELGHHAAGHLDSFYSFLRLPARIIPFLHKAYSRQCEYTCDKLGLEISRDYEHSAKAISMLGCGCNKLNGSLNLLAFEKQEVRVPAVSGFLAEIISTHPRLTRRIIALKSTRIIG